MSLTQCQLLEYAKWKLRDRLPAGTLAYARPWTFLYRPPTDECVGVMIDIDGNTRAVIRVEEMQADREGLEVALRMQHPGPPPTPEQREAWRNKFGTPRA